MGFIDYVAEYFRGPAGPAGPAGEAGPTGPAGEAGPAGASTLYVKTLTIDEAVALANNSATPPEWLLEADNPTDVLVKFDVWYVYPDHDTDSGRLPMGATDTSVDLPTGYYHKNAVLVTTYHNDGSSGSTPLSGYFHGTIYGLFATISA